MIRRTSTLVTVVLWIILMGGVGASCANGVAPYATYQSWDRDTYAFVAVILMVFALTVFVEYLAIDRLLGRPPKTAGRLALWVLLINMMTNPALQWFYYYCGRHWEAVASATASLLPWAGEGAKAFLIAAPRANWGAWAATTLLAGEVAVVVAEFVAFRLVFAHLYRCGRLEASVSSGSTLLIVIAANLASYFFVLIIFFMVGVLTTGGLQ